MKVSKAPVTSTVAALMSAARVTEPMRVEWGSGTRVEFKRGNNHSGIALKYVMDDYDRESIWLSSEWSDLDSDKQDLVLAAAIKLGYTCFMVNKDLVSIISSIHTVIIEPDVSVKSKPRHATSWENAQEYGLSGYRKNADRRVETKVETAPITVSTNVKVTGKGLMIGLGVLAVGLGICAIAASVSDN